MEARSLTLSFSLFLILLFLLPYLSYGTSNNDFLIKEATLKDLQQALNENKLTSRKLVEFYLKQINDYNPRLKGVIEVNPDALSLADKADQERKAKAPGGSDLPILHGIPVFVKDNMATNDKLNTTAGSYALLGSTVPRDATVVAKLKEAGAIILGKASLTQWSGFRSSKIPGGWNARSGQGLEPYTSKNPCGSSSGSAISVSSNLVSVSLGSETDGSILCPSIFNSVVGFKPTVGLTSRAGVVPISSRQDTVGPICRTVSDAVYVLDVIVGTDPLDKETNGASQFIPSGGYAQFLKADGLQGKRLGIVADFFIDADNKTFENFFEILRKKGAILVRNVKIDNFNETMDSEAQMTALLNEFKTSLNAYLTELISSPIRSLSAAIEFNKKNSNLEKTEEYGQDFFEKAEATNGSGMEAILAELKKLSKDGIEKTMNENNLDAIVAPSSIISTILAIGGYPGITVPAGYTPSGTPFGIVFGGLKGSESKLIEIAYGFEQATKSRKPPALEKLSNTAFVM